MAKTVSKKRNKRSNQGQEDSEYKALVDKISFKGSLLSSEDEEKVKKRLEKLGSLIVFNQKLRIRVDRLTSELDELID